jgi:hypothetical protein
MAEKCRLCRGSGENRSGVSMNINDHICPRCGGYGTVPSSDGNTKGLTAQDMVYILSNGVPLTVLQELAVREFKSVAWYNVRGRKVAGVRLDQEEEREGLLAKLQAEGGVIIDGERHQIDGVESFTVSPLRKGMEIGLRLADNTTGQEEAARE